MSSAQFPRSLFTFGISPFPSRPLPISLVSSSAAKGEILHLRGTMSTQQATTSSLDTRQLLKTLVALKKGDFSVRLPDDWTGVAGKIADTLNEVIELHDRLTKELERVSRVVGKEGKITQRETLPNADGSWLSLVESVNTLI